MGHIREYYERMVRLRQSDWDFISAQFERKCYPKKSVLTPAGSMEEHLSFIDEGIIRYYVPGEETELTFQFGFARQFASAYDSLLSGQPSKYTLETLTPTVTWRISRTALEEVYARTRVGDRLGRLAAEKLFLAKSERELSLLKYSAAQRYRNLLSDQPELLLSIPLKYIASYLGVTPQGLSRIRRRIS